MTAYRIGLDDFYIGRTRAPDEDTDVISFQGTLDGNTLPVLNLSTGDVDDGYHLIDLQFDPIDLNPTSVLDLKFAIMNSGHANEEAFRKKVDDALTTASVSVVPISGPASAWIQLAKVLFDLTDVICDGWVASDCLRGSGKDIDQLTVNYPHIYHTARGYPGTDSDVGCGKNSNYTVSWFVQRLNPDEPRLDLLVHLSGYGDRTFHENQFGGSRNESRQVEGFSLQINPPVQGLTLRYMAHLQGRGDVAWVDEGQFIGTRGEERRLEGFAIALQGPQARNYYVQYNARVQNKGDTGPILNGQFCGTRGEALRLEGMQVSIRPIPQGPPVG